VLGCLVLLAVGCPLLAAEGNRLRNGGFEDGLAGWQKRTPDDSVRTLAVLPEAARSGQAGLVLRNRSAALTRLRQGQDRDLVIPPGSIVEYTAWTRPELSAGTTAVRFYCMGDADRILTDSARPSPPGASGWQCLRLLVRIPEGTRYCMAYLEVRDGTGQASFDDAALTVVADPPPARPRPRVVVLTDLAPEAPLLQELAVLLGDGLVVCRGESELPALAAAAGCVVVFRNPGDAPGWLRSGLDSVRQRALPTVMDIGTFAVLHGSACTTARDPAMAAPPARPAAAPGTAPAAPGLRVLVGDAAVRGFRTGQVIPWHDGAGRLRCLAAERQVPDMVTVASGPDGLPALVRLGSVVAVDLLSLGEPHCRNAGAYYKLLPVANLLTNPVGLGEYYDRRYSYAEFVDQMRQLAETSPRVRFEDEGPGSGERHLFSLNLGRPDAPLYLLYAACHGSEWEPAYGLLTFARRLAAGDLTDGVDLERVAVKILPILNPSGYDAFARRNANGVDLNRQGDECWDAYPPAGPQSGDYGPGKQDWKGAGPFTEPEAVIYRRLCGLPNLHCVLDFHGNMSATNNKLGVVPITARADNDLRGLRLQDLVNSRLQGRFVLRQADEDSVSPYLIACVYPDSARPTLINSSCRGRYGILVELTAGYRTSYGTLLQTDVTGEICKALFTVYPPP